MFRYVAELTVVPDGANQKPAGPREEMAPHIITDVECLTVGTQ